ncbi:MAG: alpha-glucan family phosphorylase [Bacteroidales bacterium]
MLKPDYIFETSWEIGNKVGGIHTVISTKALTLKESYGDKLILVGPDLWRDRGINPEFIEDQTLFANWKSVAAKEGLKVKTGRWKIPGNPIVILIDFTPFIAKKNEIFSEFWEIYKLDSITGQWDYIEPAVFGYAAGMLIENFCSFYLSFKDVALAHFHEWMTGTGILYLRNYAPHISTVFTTHATVVGRSIAGNGFPLYKNLHLYDGDVKARDFNVVAKQSLEKLAAAQADCFTTVSEITAMECKQLLEREVDVITPNGFEDDFVPIEENFEQKRTLARERLIKVAESLFSYKLPEKIKFLGTSGRYEFSNKGIDVFIDALGKVNAQKDSGCEIIAFLLVPANNYGPRKDLLQSLSEDRFTDAGTNNILTHYLHDADYDQILQRIKRNNLTNSPTDKVKVIFVPVYLDGQDGIFNLNYWDMLIGLDMTIFPSYYEPWGYTPLESLAFYVPTITTSLSGFGRWILNDEKVVKNCIKVVDRNDDNYEQVVDEIVETILQCGVKTEEQFQEVRKHAHELSRIALWKNFIQNYYKAFDVALEKSKEHREEINRPLPKESSVQIDTYKSNKPVWRSLDVKPNPTSTFPQLEELAKNLWWSWNHDAINLFRYIDEDTWEKTDADPLALLNQVSYERILELEKNKTFIEFYNKVLDKFRAYMNQKQLQQKGIAYFSMEFGICNCLRIYSGGLGILAGDYLKQASDSNVDMVGVGILYKYGYFSQGLSIQGEQQANYHEQILSNLPATLLRDHEGKPIFVEVAFPGRVLKIQVWLVNVGRIKLYLLDTNRKDNSAEDRSLTDKLYGGDHNYRLQQEIILGIGGIRMLERLGIHKDVYHMNEGHAALAGIERINTLMKNENLMFSECFEIVKSSSLFTTHTPVPAGHDAFSQDLIMSYMGHYPERLKISWEEFMDLGRSRPGKREEHFSMSNLAANLSQEINAVSKLHGEVTKDMFNNLWEGYFVEESPIGYVTNGVHLSSWASENWLKLYVNTLGQEIFSRQSNEEAWAGIYNIDNRIIWENRNLERNRLYSYLKTYLTSKYIQLYRSPKDISIIQEALSDDCLTIGFARRFATYKRGHLLFTDLERLKHLVNHPERPIRFIFAGKAHPNDGAGQGIIRQIVEISKRPEFIGKIIFVEDYDIELAKKLVAGVDIWLNTPTRPLEASGTSGMKAVMNGVMNFSVLDGWWCEGYRENAGWALDEKNTYENSAYQDELDVETIYNKLEFEIAPMFYERNNQNIPVKWVEMVKNCIVQIAPHFTMKRMLDDYYERFYNRLFVRSDQMRADDFAMAKEIADWKRKILYSWENIKVESVRFSDALKTQLELGQEYQGEIILDLNGLSHLRMGLEIVIASISAQNVELVSIVPMNLVSETDGKLVYKLKFKPPKAGNFSYGIRLFPTHEKLVYRHDFAYVKWI